jgi:hypothetical protein
VISCWMFFLAWLLSAQCNPEGGARQADIGHGGAA